MFPFLEPLLLYCRYNVFRAASWKHRILSRWRCITLGTDTAGCPSTCWSPRPRNLQGPWISTCLWTFWVQGASQGCLLLELARRSGHEPEVVEVGIHLGWKCIEIKVSFCASFGLIQDPQIHNPKISGPSKQLKTNGFLVIEIGRLTSSLSCS